VISKRARYRDISRLGSGGMATVVLAEDLTLGRLVALKRVHTLGDASGRSRLRREALVGASLSHPNLVSVYDVVAGEHGEHVIVMEYVEGDTLRDALRRGSGLAVAEALRVIEGVSAALDAIHRRGIVHRDVKPANILLGANGAVKLADLGIASAADRTQITTDGAVLGTFSYMAPEQLGGAPPTAAVDVYALSAVAFEVLSGRKARLEPNPLALAHAISTQPPPDLREAWPQAPRAAAELLVRSMSREPSQRPHSAGELAGRLRAALEPHPTTPMPAGALDPPRSSSARDPTARRGSAPAPEAPREPTGPSYEDDLTAAAGVQRAKRRDGGGSAPLWDRRADASPAPQSPAGSKQPSGRRETPTPPVIAPSASAPSARRSGAVIAAAPNPAARPPTDPGPRKGRPIPGKTRRPPVATRRHGRSQGRILAAASIALAAVAVLVAVAISAGGSQPRTPNGATASRHSSRVPARSRTTAKTSGPLKSPTNRTTATGANSAPANASATSGSNSPPTNRTTATGASSPPTNRTTATGASSPPAGTSASPSANAPAGNPVAAVESFYSLAASHRYAEAWALADPTFRAQLGGYRRFQAGQAGDRSITFDATHVLSRSSTDVTVAVQTTSMRTDGTQHCLGAVDLASGGAPESWLLHLIHINCT
jgi:serine/threonine protein kinase